MRLNDTRLLAELARALGVGARASREGGKS